MAITKSELAWIVVKDLKKARDFFVKKVGLTEQSYSEEHAWIELAGSEGGSILGVCTADDRSPIKSGQNAVMTFSVENIDEVSESFRKAGVQLIGPILVLPGHVKMQFFKDPDGNLFQICQKLD